MASYLDSAFAQASGMYSNCSKAVGCNPGATLASGPVGIGMQQSRLLNAKEQYSHYRGWVYTAIKVISQRISGTDFSIGRLASKPTGKKLLVPNSLKNIGDRLSPIESHPFLDAIECPNPIMVRSNLLHSSVASLLLTGRSFWWVSEAETGLQIWPIPSTWLSPADPMRGGWKLRPYGTMEEIDLPAESVACFALSDPSNPFNFVSPLQSQAHSIAIDEAILDSQYKSFRNGPFPNLLVRVGKLPGAFQGDPGTRPTLTGNQRQEIVDAILAMHKNAGSKNAPLIVDGMLESIEKLSNSVEEMDYGKSSETVKARILQALGVSPAVLGQLENSNRASAWAAESSFCVNTVNPIIELLSEGITKWARAYYQEKLVCWLTPCSADDRELTLSEWKAALASGLVSQNEYRRRILNLPDVAGGDVFRDAMGNEIEGGKTFHLNGHARV